MKKNLNTMLALLTAGLLIANGAIAQWSRNAVTGQTFLTANTDFVGIGTQSPQFILDVRGTGTATMSFKSTSGSSNFLLDRSAAGFNASLTYKTNGVGEWQSGMVGNSNYNIRNVTLNAPAITILAATNNVGIGLANPTQRLHVSGNILATGDINAANVFATGTLSGSTVIGATVTSTGNVSAVNFIGSGNIDVSGYVGFGSVERLTDGGSNTIASNSSFVPTTDCGGNLGFATQRWNNVNVCSTVGIGLTATAAVPLQVGTGSDVSLTGGGYVVTGLVTGLNIGMDNNEIMCRNNGVAATLFINHNGGDVIINGTKSTGNVGIGTTAPTTNLQLVHDQFVGSANAGGFKLTNVSNSATWTEYVSQSSSGLALYFNDLLRGTFDNVSGAYAPVSDLRLKKNIEALPDLMDKVMALKPCQYEFKSNPTEGQKYFGFIAQELEKVFPEVVMVCKNDSKEGGEDVHTVKYTELIPVMFKAIQEQQQVAQKKAEELDAMKKEIADLKDVVKQLDQSLAQCCMSYGEKSAAGGISTDAARLEQNAPNPFSEKTVVKFYIPQNFKSAMVKIYSMSGDEMKSFNISASGLGQVEISGNTMSSGVYQYTLLIDGKAVDSTQMILTK